MARSHLKGVQVVEGVVVESEVCQVDTEGCLWAYAVTVENAYQCLVCQSCSQHPQSVLAACPSNDSPVRRLTWQ